MSWKNHPRLSKKLLKAYASMIPEKLLRESVIEMASKLTSEGERRETIRSIEMIRETFPNREDIEFERVQHLNPIDKEKALYYAKRAATGGSPTFFDWHNRLLTG